MRLGTALPALVGIGLLAMVSGCRRPAPPPPATSSNIPPIESGVYGFSGAGVPMEQPEGVIGECIWIFDRNNQRQIAKADCSARAPGKYRIVLAPGHYVLHGPGGILPLEIKAGQWLKVDSIASLPLAP
ncbi:MAG TPA: hypothetical protein VFB15_07605 [Candidatus Binataceae bacterium]|nr:hypothetical protein [Candidatus Binataceae bacterium]